MQWQTLRLLPWWDRAGNLKVTVWAEPAWLPTVALQLLTEWNFSKWLTSPFQVAFGCHWLRSWIILEFFTRLDCHLAWVLWGRTAVVHQQGRGTWRGCIFLHILHMHFMQTIFAYFCIFLHFKAYKCKGDLDSSSYSCWATTYFTDLLHILVSI